jgi:outer membrane protein assembly factor BamB
MSRSLRCLLAVTLLATVPLTDAADPARSDVSAWVHWRGPSGQGYSDDTRVPLTWSEKENVLWKTKLPGHGNSTPVVWGDRVFLTAASKAGEDRYVLCVRVKDGEVLWQQTAATKAQDGKSHIQNGYASPSCTTDGKHVYAFFGTPGLFCYDMEGKLIWKHTFGKFISDAGWGTAASPFLYDDLVIQNCDNDGKEAGDAPQALVALDKESGKVRWTTLRNMGRGFSTPRLIPVAGGRVDLVLNGPLGVVGYDPKTGKERWRSTRNDGKDQMRFGEPIPVNDANTLFVLSGRPGPWQALKLPDSGEVSKTNLIFTGERKGHRDVGSPILWEGLVYQADNKGFLSCYDLKSGKELFNERISQNGKAQGSPVALRGKLLFALDDGETVVIEPGRSLKVAGRNRLGNGTAFDFGASPAIVDGRMFLRSQSYLYCIGEKP